MNKNKHIDSEVKEEDSDMGWNFNREEDDEEGDQNINITQPYGQPLQHQQPERNAFEPSDTASEKQ